MHIIWLVMYMHIVDLPWLESMSMILTVDLFKNDNTTCAYNYIVVSLSLVEE